MVGLKPGFEDRLRVSERWRERDVFCTWGNVKSQENALFRRIDESIRQNACLVGVADIWGLYVLSLTSEGSDYIK